MVVSPKISVSLNFSDQVSILVFDSAFLIIHKNTLISSQEIITNAMNPKTVGKEAITSSNIF